MVRGTKLFFFWISCIKSLERSGGVPCKIYNNWVVTDVETIVCTMPTGGDLSVTSISKR